MLERQDGSVKRRHKDVVKAVTFTDRPIPTPTAPLLWEWEHQDNIEGGVDVAAADDPIKEERPATEHEQQMLGTEDAEEEMPMHEQAHLVDDAEIERKVQQALVKRDELLRRREARFNKGE